MAYTEVARLADVPVGSAVKVEVGGEPVAVVRLADDVVRAVHNVCSHQQYDLAPEGIVAGNDIECALHGSMFNLDTGEPDALPAVKPIPVYACRIDGDSVLVDLDQQLNDAPVPRH